MIDDEVVKIVRKAQRKAKSILKSKVKYLHQIAEALLKYETINGDDLFNIMNGNAIVRSPNGVLENASKNIIKKKRTSGKSASGK